MISRRISICLSILLLVGVSCYQHFFWTINGSDEFDFGEGLALLLLYLPFSLFPFIAAIILSACLEKPSSQWILTTGSILYGIWSLGIWPFRLTMFTVGFYALPVLVPLWIAAIIVNRRLRLGCDKGVVEKHIADVIAENPQVVADYKAGAIDRAGFLVNRVVKRSDGKADPKMVAAMIKKMLKE